MDLTDILRTLCDTAAEYALLSSAHGTNTKTDNLGHEASHEKFQMIQIIQNMLSGQKGNILDIKNRKIPENFPSICKLSNTSENISCFKQIFTRDIRKYFDLNENENKTYKNMCGIAKARFRGKFIALDTNVRKVYRFTINNLNFYLKELGKKEKLDPKQKKGNKEQKINWKPKYNKEQSMGPKAESWRRSIKWINL